MPGAIFQSDSAVWVKNNGSFVNNYVVPGVLVI